MKAVIEMMKISEGGTDLEAKWARTKPCPCWLSPGLTVGYIWTASQGTELQETRRMIGLCLL